MSTCGKNLAAFHGRKLLTSHFSEMFSNAKRPDNVRKLSFLTDSYNRVLHSRMPSDDVRRHRSQLETPFKCLNGRMTMRYISSSAKRDMRFVQFAVPVGGNKVGPKRLGALLIGHDDGGEDVVVDISGVDPTIPNDLVTFLQAGPEQVKKARRAVAEGRSVHEVSRVRLLPPVYNPDKVACVGHNYKDHCEEQKLPFPPEPVFFSKWSSCIIGPNCDIPYPSITQKLDWEVEVALIIGQKAKDVSPDVALDYIFGVCVAQDITARDWQGTGPRARNGGQWLLAKTSDSSCPLGPAVVQLSSIPDLKNMALRCSINGVLKQDSNTSNMIHSFEEIVAFLSRCCTLLPGDVILTGTPAGVGVFRNPREFLKVGDIIDSEVEGIGKLKNKIVEG